MSSSNQKNPAGTSSGENIKVHRRSCSSGLCPLHACRIHLLSSHRQGRPGFTKPAVCRRGPFAYQNWGGKFGFKVGHYFIFSGFGLGSFFIPLIIGAFSLALLRVKYFRLWKNVLRFLLATVLISVILGYLAGQSTFLGAGPGGEFGYLIADWLNGMMGKVGHRMPCCWCSRSPT
ncbi:MAG: DNA translocase FtsK 4TM domain-containing protein [Marinilabiliales bacterium]|nr:DNA translocase FtsK 4TM domain-containing protein [Marinilabiliales bacterium]